MLLRLLVLSIFSFGFLTFLSSSASAAQIASSSAALADDRPSVYTSHSYEFTLPTSSNLDAIEFNYCTEPEGPCVNPIGLDTYSAAQGQITGLEQNDWTTNVTSFGQLTIENVASSSGEFVQSGQVVGVEFQAVQNSQITACQPWDTSSDTCYVRITTYINSLPVDQGLATYTINEQAFGPPTVSITDPAPYASASGTLNIQADATAGSGIERVEFYVNDQLQGTDYNYPYSHPWDSTTYPHAPASIYAIAYDWLSQSTQSDTVVVSVYNYIPPTVTITQPTQGSSVSGITTITADANDNSGISLVRFYIDGDSQHLDYTAPYTYDWDTSQHADGAVEILAVAYDLEYLTAQSEIVTVNVNNNVAPSVALTAPADNAVVSGQVDITADASDDQSVDRVEFYINSVLHATDYSAPYQASWDVIGLSGAYNVEARAYDNSGLSASDTAQVTVDNSIHVADIDYSSYWFNTKQTRWKSDVTVTVVDASGNPAEGVYVETKFTRGSGRQKQCTTDASGTCTVTSAKIAKRYDTMDLSILDLTLEDFTYQPANNIDSDGDSDGTTITVHKPS